MHKFSSVFKIKKELTQCAMAKGWKVMATDFPIDINRKMMYVFTEYDETCEMLPLGIVSIVLTKEQVEEYLEYIGESKLF